MNRNLDPIEAEALGLPEKSRARLVEHLFLSFREEPGGDEAGIVQAWIEEAERRDQKMDSGREPGIPAEEVFRKLRSSLR
jgi:putative addiction module component (TIGR02574 family)